jgi:hypothetical protein
MMSKVGRDCELGLFCVNVGAGIVGCANKCMAENTAPKKKKKFWQRKLLTQVVIQNRKLGVKRATKLRKKVRRLQRMHRVVSEIVKKQAAGQLSRNHLETELMTKHAAKMMISKTVAVRVQSSNVAKGTLYTFSHFYRFTCTNSYISLTAVCVRVPRVAFYTVVL